jgi:hypothetical protein
MGNRRPVWELERFSTIKNKMVSIGRLMWKGNPEEAKKPVPHWFHFPLQMVAIGCLVYWHWKLPLPNKAVLALAAIAALMVLAEMRPLHKAIYFFVIIALVATENRAINDDRAKFEKDQASQRAKETAQFQGIAGDLKQAITDNKTHFDKVEQLQGLQIQEMNASIKWLQETRNLEKTSAERQLKIRMLDLARTIFDLSVRAGTQTAYTPNPNTELIFHNAIAEFNTQISPSVRDVAELLKKRKWTSQECDRALVRAYTIRPEMQFMYIIGCGQDLEREANKMP